MGDSDTPALFCTDPQSVVLMKSPIFATSAALGCTNWIIAAASQRPSTCFITKTRNPSPRVILYNGIHLPIVADYWNDRTDRQTTG